MRGTSRTRRVLLATTCALALATPPVVLYIGPGAGFAAAGSFLVLLGTFLLAFGIILIWPFKAAYRAVTFPRRTSAKAKRVVVVGLDGFDPGLARKYLDQGLLPNFKKLAEEGCFRTLATACPSISPVAWSTFATGVDASRHNIYDFLTRDPVQLRAGPLVERHPLRAAHAEPRPRGRPVRAPDGLPPAPEEPALLEAPRRAPRLVDDPARADHFPPQKFKNGTLLSGMCVPDIQGTQGTFSFYSTRKREGEKHIGGQQYLIVVRNGRVESNLTGRAGPDGPSAEMPLHGRGRRLEGHAPRGEAEGADHGRRHDRRGRSKEYTPWLTVPFGKVTGIVRFYIQHWAGTSSSSTRTPIHIDPERPAMPISHPFVYSIYLAKSLGPFATLGLAEDTWALNERVIDEAAFLKQAWLFFDERKKQLWDAIDKTKRGFVSVVFDTSDRISHMFWRTLEPDHPANAGKEVEAHKRVIPETYQRMDALVGEVRAKLGDDPTRCSW
jgi:hypothetical protein